MLRSSFLLLLTPLWITSCATKPQPDLQSASTPQSQPPLAGESRTDSRELEPRDDRALTNTGFGRQVLNGIRIEAVVYDSRTHSLLLADQPDGPGSLWTTAKAAGQAHQGLAAINAGFFTAEGEPLGLVITKGTTSGAMNRSSSLGSGFFVQSPDAKPKLIRREQYQGASLALQSGPFLIESGTKVSGLSPKSSTARSFIATDGGYGWIFARTGPCSLDQLAAALRGQSILGIPVHTALNLDGGRSSELWVSGLINGGPAQTRPLWNKPVRNFLILQPQR